MVQLWGEDWISQDKRGEKQKKQIIEEAIQWAKGGRKNKEDQRGRNQEEKEGLGPRGKKRRQGRRIIYRSK